ncbi:WD repeat-containing protein [Sparassis crispa]|uniref:WD repeat-containing protein JIP5 n=1 Tax=Sparassis crispa TaxID=139825 RepID=A0A401GMN2_9APHY|nr:WD repeat-containing protein [Sparassis crispa]GBE83429.1 WD repeat-containing protein [Sparassis crispa]
MPDIPVGGQIFDLIFHPHESLVFTGLLSGEVKAFGYDDQGKYESKFTVRPSKRSCRGVGISEDGSQLWAAGKGKALHTIDTATGVVIDTRAAAHDVAINRVKRLLPHLLSTGDDDGVIKLWDPRKKDAIRAYTHHFDFISDFLWLNDAKQLVSTSGDGTLSVIDVRAKKTEPFAQSEYQEDELLSIVPIKGGKKFAVGTQLGILSIFNRRNGWGDCVDRIPGHPQSIDTLCNVPSYYPSSHSTILSGSSDGLLRAVQLFPTKLLGVVADHGEFPIERIAVDRAGEGRWVGSAGHEEVLKLTDLREVFEDENEDEDGDGDGEKVDGSDSEDGEDEDAKKTQQNEEDANPEEQAEERDADSSEDEEAVLERKKRKRKDKDPLHAAKKTKRRNEVEAKASFFANL